MAFSKRYAGASESDRTSRAGQRPSSCQAHGLELAPSRVRVCRDESLFSVHLLPSTSYIIIIALGVEVVNPFLLFFLIFLCLCEVGFALDNRSY